MTRSLPPPPIPGLTFIDALGSGGYADVFLYEQDMPSRKVAVKVLRDTGLSAASVDRFTAEANAMARLEHPHIVPVYSAGTTADGRPYLVMMYYPQASLAERARRERFSVAEVLRIGIQLAAAVETAHRAGLLHRDIKPANVLTSQYGAPGLTDFGIAAQVAQAEHDDAGVSVPWSPVETLYATGPATVRSDVYALAATLWHLLVGRSPFEVPGGDNSTFALMRRVRDVPAPSTGRSDVPTSLDRLLRTAMAKQPHVRPASALQLARSLQAIEQELRLTRTDIILPADAEAPAPDAGQTRPAPLRPAPEDDATRLRAQQIVPPFDKPRDRDHPETTPAPAATTPAATAASGARTDAHDPATVRREVVRADDDADPEHRDPANRRGLLAGVGIAGVCLAVIAFWQLGVNRATPAPTQTGTPTQSPPALTRAAPAPGAPAVTGARTGDKATFTWTYDNALDSDYFNVSVEGRAQVERTQDPTITLVGPAPLCIGVKVLRADGSNYPKEYSAKVCA